jgi:putative transposase
MRSGISSGHYSYGQASAGPKHGGDLRRVVDGMLYIAKTGCQWRYLPAEFGPWTRVWSQFRRWSRNGIWERALAALHCHARDVVGRAESKPSMIVIDTHLSRGASNGGATFHQRGGPWGATNGAKRIVAVDVTGLPVAARAVPANVAEQTTVELLLGDLVATGQAERLELVMVDKGCTKRACARLSRRFGFEVRQVGWDPQPTDPVLEAGRTFITIDTHLGSGCGHKAQERARP